MRRCCLTIPMFVALLAAPLYAQATAPSITAGLKQAYGQIKANLTKAADEMSDENYAFQATKEERTFGGWIGHVADAQMGMCSRVSGTPQNIGASSKTSKADLVAALKQSFDACDAVYDGLTDVNAADPIAGGRGAPQARIGILINNVAHSNECYGSIAVYMRLKGLVPPSTEGMMMGRGR